MNAGTEAESGVRYTTVAIGLHWLMVVLLMGMVSVGVYMSDLQLSPQKLQLYSWHKWGGVTASMPPLLQRAAHAGHIALYLLMIAIPLSGWLMSSAKGFQTVYFGVLPIPDLLVKNEELGKALKQVHELLNWALILLVLGHVGAAIKHHFIDKDGLLWRMSLRRPRTGEH